MKAKELIDVLYRAGEDAEVNISRSGVDVVKSADNISRVFTIEECRNGDTRKTVVLYVEGANDERSDYR